MAMSGKINIPMVLMSVVGGVLGWVVGEFLLRTLDFPEPLLMGLYFGVLALFICGMCLLAETLFPIVNGLSWKRSYARTAWLYVVPFSLIGLFVLGMLFQFAYQFELKIDRTGKDVFLLIDSSSSMESTDPYSENLQAAQNLVRNMKSDRRVCVIQFSDTPQMIYPLTKVDSNTKKDEICAAISSIRIHGGTSIQDALAMAYEHYVDNAGKKGSAQVILLSDGHNEFDIQEAVEPFVQNEIIVNTVGVKQDDEAGGAILSEIAGLTNGAYVNATEVDQIEKAFATVYAAGDDRMLLDDREGSASHSFVYSVLRVLFITLLSIFIALVLVVLFDNRGLIVPLCIGGLLGGLLAGLLLEWLLPVSETGQLLRLVADILIAGVFTVFTVFAKQREYLPTNVNKHFFDTTDRSVKTRSATDSDRTKKRF